MKATQMVATLAAVAIIAGSLIACDSAPDKPAQSKSAAAAQQSKEPVLYTGQQALARTAALAQQWAIDAQPVRVESDVTDEANGQSGKSTVWRAWFASPSRRAVKQFICSGSRLPDSPPLGVTTGSGEMPYSSESAALAFQAIVIKADSDKAFSVAQEHGGSGLMKKNPKQPVTYVLEGDPKQHVPLWYVVYGINAKNTKGIGVIDATTGTFLRAGK